MTEEEIHYICKKYDIKNYKINPDMTVDVDSFVVLTGKSLTNNGTTRIPFGKVSGNFFCSEQKKLTTLEGCPNYVGGYFFCEDNKLLSTLQHLPMNFYVGKDFCCRGNPIHDAKEFGRLFFGTIGGQIKTDHEHLNKFLNENKNPPKKDLPRLLSELRRITL